MVEQIEQGLSEKDIQKPKKGRSKEEKMGRIKYNQFLLKRVLSEVEELRSEFRVIRNALENAGLLRFAMPMLQKFAFGDQIDEEIFEWLRVTGSNGMFPKDVATQMSKYNLKYYDVSRRIVRMNKRLILETGGKRLFEKRGHKWALTRYAFDAYGATESEISADMAETEKEAEQEFGKEK